MFPNVEVRLDIGTIANKWINLHLLVNPADPDHVERIESFLGHLTFTYKEELFHCRPSDFARLGRRLDPGLTDDRSAIRLGGEQFKVSFEQLRSNYKQNGWARSNILIAVAASSKDGTAGIDSAAAALRREVESLASIIFSANDATRRFWVGEGKLSAPQVIDQYASLKPCLHGSDAHNVEQVGRPDLNRFCWIFGNPSFDALWQACLDPRRRAFIGPQPPAIGSPSQVVAEVRTDGTPWLQTSTIELSPGLVAIIGAKGSGKTALADIIAATCGAAREIEDAEKSFLSRAKEFLYNAYAKVTWGDGAVDSRPLNLEVEVSDASPKVRYLTQQFVETLCESTGPSDNLIAEVERVVFEAHEISSRDGTTAFSDLLALRTQNITDERRSVEHAIDVLQTTLTEARRKGDEVPQLTKLSEELRLKIERLSKDREKLMPQGDSLRVQRLSALTAALEKASTHVRNLAMQEQELLGLQKRIAVMRAHDIPQELAALKASFPQSGLTEAEWSVFALRLSQDADRIVQQKLREVASLLQAARGGKPAPKASIQEPFFDEICSLDAVPLSLLAAEKNRVESLVSIDLDSARRLTQISSQIASEQAALTALELSIVQANEAKARIPSIAADRDSLYLRALELIVAEEKVLNDLYEPLAEQLAKEEGTLRKLSFSVVRTVDLRAWASRGEILLDARKATSLQGRGTLEDEARSLLQRAWESGTAQDAAGALKAFIEKHEQAFKDGSRVAPARTAEYRAWQREFGQWLYSTDHISLNYAILYDGVDIRKLSPGTRGIVLLLLYLALDTSDGRPLIIDQPEENLDPRSIFDELVGLFDKARERRQVIIVTHNANLVVNTDVDQIVVATAGPHAPNSLPEITYVSGGLEDLNIRFAVCELLEGGEQALRQRARRLRVPLSAQETGIHRL